MTATDRHYLDAAGSLGLPDGAPLPIADLADAAGRSYEAAKRARARLIRAGLWRWGNAPKQSPSLSDADVLAAARRFDGRPSSIAAALGVSTLTINRYRARLRRSGDQWTWPDAPNGRPKGALPR